MGLFEKKITFTTTEDGDFLVYEGKKDISDSIAGIWWFRSDHLIAYDENTGRTLILYNMKDAEAGTTYEGGVFAETDTLLYVRDADRMFDLFYRGVSVTNRIVFCNVDEDLWFYDPLEENTFVLPQYESIERDVVAATIHASTRGTDAFCYRTDDSTFSLVYRGVDYTSSIIGIKSDSDVILYVPDVERMFLARGAVQLKKGEWKEDDYSDDGSTPFYKKTGEGQFFIFYQGRDVTGETAAFKLANDVILYIEENNSYYRVEDGWIKENGAYQIATTFVENCSAMWRGNGEKLEIYHKGRPIIDEVQLQRIGDDGIAMHERSQSMFQLEGMIQHTDNVFRGIPG